MKRKRIVYMIALSLCTLKNSAQPFPGYGSSVYGGVQTIVYNPALISSVPNRLEVHLVSLQSTFRSDYNFRDFNEGLGFRSGFQFTDGKTTPRNDNNFYKSVDILGPSVVYQYNESNSVGLISRLRGILNLNNLDGLLYDNISTGFIDQSDFSNEISDFSGTLHVWGEIGLSYGYTFHHHNYSITVGATLKYLQGIGGLYAHSSRIDFQYNAESNRLSSLGELIYGETRNFNDQDIELNTFKGGFGFDLGLVYESTLSSRYYDRPLKIGISLHDVGSIKYENASNSIYDLDDAIHVEEFETKTLKEVLNQNYRREGETINKRIFLPTAIHFFMDVNIRDNFYFAFESSTSMIKKSARDRNRIYSYYTLNPRFEKKWISIFSPITIQQHSGINWGVGVRTGIIVLGSQSIISNVISSSRVSDVYAAIRIPLDIK